MVRFGVVGTNWITEAFLKAADQIEDFQLSAVYSRTEEKAKEFAGKYGVNKIYTDLEAMACSGDIDAVYIASPNSLHAEQAVIFMEHKVHVLCEKPIASNTKELQRMIHSAKENNVLLMEALKSTFLPNFKAVQENLHKIGQVRRYFASYCQYSSRYDAYRQGTVLNAFDPKFSNGSLMDIGIYCVYPLVALFGKPEEVKATGYMLESGVDGEGSIVLKYPDKDAVVMYSKIANSNLPSEIQGEDGNIFIDKINTPEKVEIHYRNGDREDLTKEQMSDSMYYEAKEFIDLIKSGKTESNINSFANSMIAMEITEEARRQIGVVYPADQK
ncbi:Gfo/Idh/MocA family oxidoreductase [Bacillus sp. ISL-47]|uniref:Gfo/Idh/MocA family protein n=1 Tax=Bacillus sp. ISL-47 TaxID=2819130 RepID=UPI001BEAF316|nr:Gfo/Idh/MocA family oxidoreductase [Bacillus sp. ISL-47]MBT2688689.1 Gfo/Idh/MocA family oxidoreductase [Bacillus sp. ISL-47]MBT2707411.1 Gfo/Idh/MocA family oxidoreductase [Pseudomonas sp. ISL-84]